jgi:hypothetical protein
MCCSQLIRTDETVFPKEFTPSLYLIPLSFIFTFSFPQSFPQHFVSLTVSLDEDKMRYVLFLLRWLAGPNRCGWKYIAG